MSNDVNLEYSVIYNMKNILANISIDEISKLTYKK